MQIACAFSSNTNPELAAEEAFSTVMKELGSFPSWMVLFGSSSCNWKDILGKLKTIAPGIPLHGGTSFLGAMGSKGNGYQERHSMGLLAVLDPKGGYGVGVAELGKDPKKAAIEATELALAEANRQGELPAVVFLTSAPGQEELILEGIAEHLGPNVPVLGGSSADNTVSGEWQQFTNERRFGEAVVISTLFPSSRLLYAFHYGYEPTAHKGKASSVAGRVLYEIDGKPAAEVYNKWTQGAIKNQLGADNTVLAETTLSPLGRVVGDIKGVPFYCLVHPDKVLATGALTLFAELQPGDEVTLMSGTVDSLISRAGRVVQGALDTSPAPNPSVAGAIVTYCGGCRLAVQDRMDEVATSISKSLGDKPFLSAFTFGEQGCFSGGNNMHGNLMISALIFTR